MRTLLVVAASFLLAGPPQGGAAGRAPLDLEATPAVLAELVAVEWSQDERGRRLALRPGGDLLLDGVPVGRRRDSCLRSREANGWSVCLGPGDEVAGGELCSGRFVRRSRIVAGDGARPAVGEVLVQAGGDGLAVSARGDVWVVPARGPAFSLPAHASGVSPASRRLALALLCLGPGLVQLAPGGSPAAAPGTRPLPDDPPPVASPAVEAWHARFRGRVRALRSKADRCRRSAPDRQADCIERLLCRLRTGPLPGGGTMTVRWPQGPELVFAGDGVPVTVRADERRPGLECRPRD